MENEVRDILKKYTKHKNIFLTESGNKAILTALKILKNAIETDSVEKTLRGKPMNPVMYFPA